MKLYPVFCGSALKNKGVQRLLDGVSYYLPSPLDIPPVRGVTPDGEPTERPADVTAPTAALAFKVATDPYVGRLVFVRVYSGALEAGSYVMNVTKGKRERIGRLLKMHANHREEIDRIQAGELGAVIGLKDPCRLRDGRLCDVAPTLLELIGLPKPPQMTGESLLRH